MQTITAPKIEKAVATARMPAMRRQYAVAGTVSAHAGVADKHSLAATIAGVQARKAESDMLAAHGALVRTLARQLLNKLPANVDFDDLAQAGMIGLLDACRKFDGSHGASFKTYASIRIHGAMLDEVRRSDWTPRSVHRRARDAGKARRQVEQCCGRAAGAVEVASSMAMSTGEYHRLLDDAGRCRMLSLESHIEDHGSQHLLALDASSPEQLQVQDGFRKDMENAINALPQREKFALTSYYRHGMSLRDIGTSLDISESRACQIISQAAKRVRVLLADWDGGDAGE